MQIRAIVLLGVMLAIVSGVTLGATLHRDRTAGEDARDAALFQLILDQVRSNYYEELTEADLLDGAFAGVMATLDEHSKLLDADDLTELAEDSAGQFGGIGIEVGVVGGRLQVVRPIPDTPASRAGLRGGDVLLGVGDYRPDPDTAPDLAEMLERLRGAPGTTVRVHLLRAADALDVDLRREYIKLRSVRTRLLVPGYAYLRISQFRDATATDLRRAISRLQAAGPLHGLVLDLRNNPGGLLRSCVAVADAFIEHGDIVTTRGRNRVDALSYTATAGDILQGAPIAVLINGGSASAAEIVAGALQDHSRARLFGSRSYGKGTVQTVMPVGQQRAIKLTTALYYTPSGRAIDNAGIKPDIRVRAPVGKSYEQTLLDAALAYLQQQRANPDQARANNPAGSKAADT